MLETAAHRRHPLSRRRPRLLARRPPEPAPAHLLRQPHQQSRHRGALGRPAARAARAHPPGRRRRLLGRTAGCAGVFALGVLRAVLIQRGARRRGARSRSTRRCARATRSSSSPRAGAARDPLPAPFKSGLYHLARAFPEVRAGAGLARQPRPRAAQGRRLPDPGQRQRADRRAARARAGRGRATPSSTARAPPWSSLGRSLHPDCPRSRPMPEALANPVVLTFVGVFAFLARRERRGRPSLAAPRRRRATLRERQRADPQLVGDGRRSSPRPSSPGETATILLFALVSFWCLREFLSLTPTPARRPLRAGGGLLPVPAAAIRAAALDPGSRSS